MERINGDLVKDGRAGCDRERAPRLDNFPARVEGVIEERINRLADDRRESRGECEGTDFTARSSPVSRTSKSARCCRPCPATWKTTPTTWCATRAKSAPGAGYCSATSLPHALFQQYLYEGLSGGERRLLHGEIAAVLEELYAGHGADITVRLARHYAEAGDVEKAVDYLRQAGERARMLYANSEAIDLFMRAVASSRRTRRLTISRATRLSMSYMRAWAMCWS